MVKVGDTQSMVFKDGDHGPWWMTDDEREQRRNQTLDENVKITKQKTKKDLLSDLKSLNVPLGLDSKSKWKIQDLKKLSLSQRPPIPLTHSMDRVIGGWSKNPKGLMQVLWERGWIDVHEKEKYRVSTLTDMLASCPDFKGEITEVETKAKEMNVRVIITPKFHAEISGEGIEYSWGISKTKYRKLKLEEKRGKENFRKNVEKCLCTTNVLTKQNVRRSAKQMRSYMMTYHALAKSNDAEQQNGTPVRTPVSLKQIQDISKSFKTHRSMLDIETQFITDTPTS